MKIFFGMVDKKSNPLCQSVSVCKTTAGGHSQSSYLSRTCAVRLWPVASSYPSRICTVRVWQSVIFEQSLYIKILEFIEIIIKSVLAHCIMCRCIDSLFNVQIKEMGSLYMLNIINEHKIFTKT